MSRTLVEVALALGGLYLTGSFGIPLILAAFGLGARRSEETKTLGTVLLVLAVVAALVLFPPFVRAVSVCQDLKAQRAAPRSLTDQILNRWSDADIQWLMQNCDDLPFV